MSEKKPCPVEYATIGTKFKLVCDSCPLRTPPRIPEAVRERLRYYKRTVNLSQNSLDKLYNEAKYEATIITLRDCGYDEAEILELENTK